MHQGVQQDIQDNQQVKPVFVENADRAIELPQIMTFGDLYVNTSTHEVTRAGRRIELTTTEYNLLELFMKHPRQILDRQTILNRVWGYDFLGETNIIEVYVRYLREKIEDSPSSPRLILTVRGMGYILKG